jgi:hypothetical protein
MEYLGDGPSGTTLVAADHDVVANGELDSALTLDAAAQRRHDRLAAFTLHMPRATRAVEDDAARHSYRSKLFRP